MSFSNRKYASMFFMASYLKKLTVTGSDQNFCHNKILNVTFVALSLRESQTIAICNNAYITKERLINVWFLNRSISLRVAVGELKRLNR